MSQIILSAATTFEEFKAEQQANVKKLIDLGIEQFKQEFLEQQFNKREAVPVSAPSKGKSKASTPPSESTALGKGKSGAGKSTPAVTKGGGKSGPQSTTSLAVSSPAAEEVEENPFGLTTSLDPPDVDIDTAKKAGAVTASERDEEEDVAKQQLVAAKRHRSINPGIKIENQRWGAYKEAFAGDAEDSE